jgi:O-methyltransferase
MSAERQREAVQHCRRLAARTESRQRRRPVADQTPLSQELLAYLRTSSLREDDILRELRIETANYPMGQAMQVMAEEGQFLALLVKLTNARTVLEIGTFTGYSTLSMARALPPDGRLITCDITRRWSVVGERYWQRAGVADRIEVRIADAAQTLAGLLDEQGPGFVDFAFIDADKANYGVYYEKTLQLMRPGGLIAIDNTFYFGRVVDSEDNSPDTAEIRRLNSSILHDDRVDLSMLPMADGITLVRKRDC